MSPLEITFWIAVALVLYGYLGFPLLTLMQGLVRSRPFQCADITPQVSLIICCFNEAKGIVAKLENLQALDYPRERLQIVVASDGSTDETELLVAQFAGSGVRHFGISELACQTPKSVITRSGQFRNSEVPDPSITLLSLPRRGKAAALNAAVAAATGEILVFSDANSLFAANALRHLVAPFTDATIGGVAGNQIYSKGTTPTKNSAAAGERLYWNFDRWMKQLQSRSGNAISATGAIYAIRRSLFQTVPEGVTDDFVTSTRVIAQGYRLVFAVDAVCHESVAGAAKAEFGRKVRITTRGLRGVIEMRSLLNPFRHGMYSLQLWSHKVLRRLIVFPLLILSIVTPMLWRESWIYQGLTLAEIAFYTAAMIGFAFGRFGRKPPVMVAVPFFFCLINAAVLVATWNLLRGRRITVWNPTGNTSETPLHMKPTS